MSKAKPPLDAGGFAVIRRSDPLPDNYPLFVEDDYSFAGAVKPTHYGDQILGGKAQGDKSAAVPRYRRNIHLLADSVHFNVFLA